MRRFENSGIYTVGFVLTATGSMVAVPASVRNSSEFGLVFALIILLSLFSPLLEKMGRFLASRSSFTAFLLGLVAPIPSVVFLMIEVGDLFSTGKTEGPPDANR